MYVTVQLTFKNMSDEIPNLLPEQNRMTWNTFMQHQRPQPGVVPVDIPIVQLSIVLVYLSI